MTVVDEKEFLRSEWRQGPGNVNGSRRRTTREEVPNVGVKKPQGRLYSETLRKGLTRNT